MDALIRRISAWDGLSLLVREWQGAGDLPPVLCLPGLVRTGADFEALAPRLTAASRIVSIDYAGCGGSARARQVDRYTPEACLRDVLDVCAALSLHRVILIGTSFGGLLGMGIAAARPGLLRAVVLNDVGPDIGDQGADFVREFIARDPALPSLDACVAYLRERLPPLSLHTDAAWRRMTELTYAPGPDGRFHPTWDTRIPQLLDRRPPELWPLFGALSHVPLLLVWGEQSNILLPATVARMRAERPDMAVASLPDIGHAPILTEPAILDVIAGFLDRVRCTP